MRKLDVEEVKKIQLELLQYVQDWCSKNNVKFWLDCGSLLGAIRHKGYIPWDDDIDIGMLRPDYDRFIREFNSKDSRYTCRCVEVDQKFEYPIAKVMDTSTILYEPDENGTKLHINIDVFVYDNAPDDQRMVERMMKKRNHLLHCREIYYSTTPSAKWYKNIAKQALRVCYKMLPEAYFDKKIVENSRKYIDSKTTCVGNFCSYSRVVCDKEIFDSVVLVDFEGMKLPAPVGYDRWLRCFYGDYMQLPPPEKRVTHHSYVAYGQD